MAHRRFGDRRNDHGQSLCGDIGRAHARPLAAIWLVARAVVRERFDRLCGPIAFRAGRRAAHCSPRPARGRLARGRALLRWSLHGRVDRPQGLDMVCGLDHGCAGQSGRQQHGLDHRRYQTLSTQSRVGTVDSAIRCGLGQLYRAAGCIVDCRLVRVAGRLFCDSGGKHAVDRTESVGSFSAAL